MAASGIGAKKVKLRRYWQDAEHKRTGCRICGAPGELHHLSGRANDPEQDCPTCRTAAGFAVYHVPRESLSPTDCPTCNGNMRVLYVRPDSVVPLCHNHHTAHHTQGKLDLSPYLSNEEAACVVLDLGLERAYRTLTGERSA